jgi:hypothetical protein
MADDDSLRQLADRIQARAVRRMGEMFKQLDGRPSNAAKQSVGAPTLISQSEAKLGEGIGYSQVAISLSAVAISLARISWLSAVAPKPISNV